MKTIKEPVELTTLSFNGREVLNLCVTMYLAES